jgi:hypothetical protein
VSRAIEEIRVSEGDVPGTLRHLAPNVLQHYFPLYHPECAVIDRDDRAVAAQMLAAARCLRVAHHSRFAVDVQVRVAVERGKAGAVGWNELLPR